MVPLGRTKPSASTVQVAQTLVASAKVVVLPLDPVAIWGAGSDFRRLRRRW